MVSFELRERIAQYIDSKITLEQLEDWITPRLSGFLKDTEPENSDIVAAVELGLAEMSDGIRSEMDFRNLLKEVIHEKTSQPIFRHANSYPTTVAVSSNQTIEIRDPLRMVWSIPTVVVGREQF